MTRAEEYVHLDYINMLHMGWKERKIKEIKFLLFLLLVSHGCGQGCCSFKPPSPLSLWTAPALVHFQMPRVPKCASVKYVVSHQWEVVSGAITGTCLSCLRDRVSRTENEWEFRTRCLLFPEEEKQRDLATNGLSRKNCFSPNWGSL